jgi:hypothetical protein
MEATAVFLLLLLQVAVLVKMQHFMLDKMVALAVVVAVLGLQDKDLTVVLKVLEELTLEQAVAAQERQEEILGMEEVIH